jgi:hypothetical protein
MSVVIQSNSLWDKLSVQDHLYLFARLRGVPEKDVKDIVDDTIDQLELTPHRHMKRNVAIAPIGDLNVMLLDDGSGGVFTSQFPTMSGLNDQGGGYSLPSVRGRDLRRRGGRLADARHLLVHPRGQQAAGAARSGGLSRELPFAQNCLDNIVMKGFVLLLKWSCLLLLTVFL